MIDELSTIWGRRVAEARHIQGWYRPELASRAGLSLSAVIKIETGIRLPSDASRLALAAALNADPNDLFAYPTETAA